jgi:hypothetical protein
VLPGPRHDLNLRETPSPSPPSRPDRSERKAAAGWGRLRDRSVLGLTAAVGRYAELVLSGGATLRTNGVAHPLHDGSHLEHDVHAWDPAVT